MYSVTTWTLPAKHRQQPERQLWALSDAVKEYLKVRSLDLEEASQRSYRNALRDLAHTTNNPPLPSFDTRLFRRYFFSVMERDYKRSTIIHRYEVCLTFFDWLVSEGHLAENPARGIRAPKPEKKLPRYLDDNEIRRLLHAYPQSLSGQRMRAISFTLLGTGIRIDELCNVTLADLDLELETLKVFGKGSKDRTVPVCRTLKSELTTWMHLRRRTMAQKGIESDYLFVSTRGSKAHRTIIHRNMIRMCDKANVSPAISPHVLRHTFATRFAAGVGKEHPGNIWQLRDILGHSSIQTTQIYVHTSARMLKDGFGDPLEKFTNP